jgi:transposase
MEALTTMSKHATRELDKPTPAGEVVELPAINPHAAGIDIGARENYVACPPKNGAPNVRRFATDTASLRELADWLKAEGVTSVAMESTGVYWRPLFELLESRGFEALLVDAQSLSHVPGRKTDMLDCQWLQQLHAHGLLKGGFRPSDMTVGLRSMVRTQRMLEAEQDDFIRRMQKALDQMNVHVHHAVSDVTGATGMRIVRAIVAGERDPAKLAALRDPRCRKSAEEIQRHLTGNWRPEHLYSLATALECYDFFARQIDKTCNLILAELASIRAQRQAAGLPTLPPDEVKPPADPGKARTMERNGSEPLRVALASTFAVDLTAIEGVGPSTAAVVMGEIGPEIQGAFPDMKPFVSYLRLAPNLAISGGKALKGKKKRRGAPVVHRLLRTAAASVRRSPSALGASYRKVAYNKGAGTAVFATARKIAQHIYRALAYGTQYVAVGVEQEERRAASRRLVHLERQAEKLGFKLVAAE